MRSPGGLGKSRGAATVGVPAPVTPPPTPAGQPPVGGPAAPGRAAGVAPDRPALGHAHG